MKMNLALWDRIIRYVLGFILVTLALSGGPLWTWLGVILIATAAWGVCPFYVLIGIKTYRERIKKA